ncbi:MAG: hypothetical protein J5698_00655 [Bacteroidaceae bacterium]|nr:hypothetical protein [Bacteroidaceae bacterium]
MKSIRFKNKVLLSLPAGHHSCEHGAALPTVTSFAWARMETNRFPAAGCAPQGA